jgi:hypothetical protein
MHGIGMMLGQVLELLPSLVGHKTEPDQQNIGVSLQAMKNLVFGLGCVSIFTPWLVMLCYFFRNGEHFLSVYFPACTRTALL